MFRTTPAGYPWPLGYHASSCCLYEVVMHAVQALNLLCICVHRSFESAKSCNFFV